MARWGASAERRCRARARDDDAGRSPRPARVDEEGYKNLVRIVSEGHVDPASGLAPSVTLDFIAEHNKGLIGLDRLHGRRGRPAHPRAGEERGARRARAGSGPASSPGASTSSCRITGWSSSRSSTASWRGRRATWACRWSRPTTPTSARARTARGSSTCRASRPTDVFAEAREAHHGSFEMFLKPADEMAHLFRDHPSAVRSRSRSPSAARRLKLKLGKPMLPTFPLPERVRRPASYFRHVAHDGPRRGGSPRSRRRRRSSRRGDLPAAARRRAGRHRQDGLPGLLPHRLGLHPATPRSTASRWGRAAARARARSSRTRCGSPTSIRSRTTCCSSAS